MARINKVVEDINALNGGEGSIGTQIETKLSATLQLFNLTSLTMFATSLAKNVQHGTLQSLC